MQNTVFGHQSQYLNMFEFFIPCSCKKKKNETKEKRRKNERRKKDTWKLLFCSDFSSTLKPSTENEKCESRSASLLKRTFDVIYVRFKQKHIYFACQMLVNGSTEAVLIMLL